MEKTRKYDKRIIDSLRKIMREMDTHSRALIKKHDITVPQIVCLYEIYEKGATTLTLLSQAVYLSPATLVGIIDRLEEKKLVKRTRGLEDRRSVFIDITTQGRNFVDGTPQLLHNRLQAGVASLPESEQIMVANSLELLVHVMEGNNVS